MYHIGNCSQQCLHGERRIFCKAPNQENAASDIGREHAKAAEFAGARFFQRNCGAKEAVR